MRILLSPHLTHTRGQNLCQAQNGRATGPLRVARLFPKRKTRDGAAAAVLSTARRLTQRPAPRWSPPPPPPPPTRPSRHPRRRRPPASRARAKRNLGELSFAQCLSRGDIRHVGQLATRSPTLFRARQARRLCTLVISISTPVFRLGVARNILHNTVVVVHREATQSASVVRDAKAAIHLSPPGSRVPVNFPPTPEITNGRRKSDSSCSILEISLS